MRFMRIGEIARQSDVEIETIRYYEQEGQLSEPKRKPSGYRQYDKAMVARLSFIRRAKEPGFTLAEIKRLLGLWFDANTRCEHVRRRAERKIAGIEEKIRSLPKMKRSMKKVICGCGPKDSIGDCPLLEGIDNGSRQTASKP